ncbi:DUF3159 domain-containing protein [Candidatus Fermentibacteria bacterium]|nr:DUF3159 domain-containing protein [Candidatus Fermentibacteria bacterium]
MSKSIIREVWEELRTVLGGRGGPIDSVLPPVVFVIALRFATLLQAAVAAVGAAVLIGILRLTRGHRIVYAAAGMAGVAVAAGLSWGMGRAEAYFLPGIVSNAFTIVLCLVSVVVRRPMVALTSHVARRWPLRWYWHPRVCPAYAEVTVAWALFFGLRLGLQIALFRRGSAAALAAVGLIGGWPATVVLLVVSYLYGVRRLRILGGPSVEEFNAAAPPPWRGQRRGF